MGISLRYVTQISVTQQLSVLHLPFLHILQYNPDYYCTSFGILGLWLFLLWDNIAAVGYHPSSIQCGESYHDIMDCIETGFFRYMGICKLDSSGQVVMCDGSALPQAEGEGGISKVIQD